LIGTVHQSPELRDSSKFDYARKNLSQSLKSNEKIRLKKFNADKTYRLKNRKQLLYDSFNTDLTGFNSLTSN